MGKLLCGTGERVTEAFLMWVFLPHVPFSHVVHAKTLWGKNSVFNSKKEEHQVSVQTHSIWMLKLN